MRFLDLADTAPGDALWVERNSALIEFELLCPVRPLRAGGTGSMPWLCGSTEAWSGVVDVSHGPNCPKHLLEEALDTPNGALVRRCFRVLNAKSMGLTITLSDITEEFRCGSDERRAPGADRKKKMAVQRASRSCY